MTYPKFVAAMLAVTPIAQAYLTQGKTVTMSNSGLVGSNAVDNDFSSLSYTHDSVNPWYNIALGASYTISTVFMVTEQ